MKKFTILVFSAFLLAGCTTAEPAPACDKTQFVDHVILDVPVQEGTTVMPGTIFTKTWQVRNDGTCDWTSDYALVHTGGKAMAAEEEIALPPVASGETVDLSVRMKAPSAAGGYASEWMLRNAAGELFGVGPQGDRPLTAELVVPELPAGVVYDFTQVVCLARWDSGRAEFLPCDGEDDEQGELDGYVRLAPNGTIEVKPNNQQGGWIAGYFPPIVIEEGEHFRATVGCVDENPDCAVAFIFKFETTDGTQAILGDPQPLSGETRIEFDLDLSPLAGQEIIMILEMQENGGRSLEARGFWLNPRIERAIQ
ncbi:MAG: NBR1-Ig-like domain-containing protein [Anaerolineales bacterium]